MSIKKWRVFLAILALFAAAQAGAPRVFGYTWTVGPDVPTTSINNIDAGPGYARDSSGNLWFAYSDGMPQPLWHFLKGTSADNLVEQYTFNPVANFGQPNHDDRYWMVGLWIDPATQYWYTTVHIEFDYDQWGYNTNSSDHFRRIDMAVSHDQGRTWTNQGDIVTPYYPTVSTTANYPGTTFYFGDGDQKLYIDNIHGYFYLYYQTATVDKATGYRQVENIMAARAPISGKMAPGTWTKWYNGAWSQPGLGGQESVTVPNCDSFAVAWNAYRRSYLAIANDYAGSFYTCPDLSGNVWTKLGQFAPNGGAGGVEWYNWAADSGNLGTEMTLGQSFRVYSAQNNAGGVATKYMTVTLSGGPTVPFNLNPYYQLIDRTSGMALAVSGASTVSGAAVVQAVSSASAPEQQWQVQSLGTGYYRLVNRNSGLVLGAPGGTGDGIQISQRTASAVALDQQWSIEATTGGYFKLRNHASSRVAGISGGSQTSGAAAIVWDDMYGVTDQEFTFAVAGVPDGKYRLTGHGSGLVLDDPAFGGAGTALDQWTSDGGANQQWNIVAASDGYFQITSAANGLAAGVGGSTASGHAVTLGAVTGTSDQRWAIQRYNGGYFRIVNKLSGLMLDVTGNSSAAGAAIDQWPGNGGVNQEWTLTAL